MPPFIFFVRLPSCLDCIDTSKGLVFVFVYLFYIVIAADLLFHRVEMFPTEGLMRRRSHQWNMNEKETLVSQPQGQGPWLPLHLIMLLIWCVTRRCTTDNYLSTALRKKALSLLSTHRHSGTHIIQTNAAICQDHLDQPPTCWTQSQDKVDLGTWSPFVFPKQNVNNTMCPEEWLKPNIPPLSECLASEPLWCRVILLKVWRDLGVLSLSALPPSWNRHW